MYTCFRVGPRTFAQRLPTGWRLLGADGLTITGLVVACALYRTRA